jgi:hypothetical protein
MLRSCSHGWKQEISRWLPLDAYQASSFPLFTITPSDSANSCEAPSDSNAWLGRAILVLGTSKEVRVGGKLPFRSRELCGDKTDAAVEMNMNYCAVTTQILVDKAPKCLIFSLDGD